MELIRRYTREAGVRNLERELARLARKAVRDIETGKSKKVEVTQQNLGDYAGVPKFRYGEIDGEDRVGVVTGLSWTSVGGDILTIEAVKMSGKGRDDPDRQSQGSDEGVGGGGVLLCQKPVDRFRH